MRITGGINQYLKMRRDGLQPKEYWRNDSDYTAEIADRYLRKIRFTALWNGEAYEMRDRIVDRMERRGRIVRAWKILNCDLGRCYINGEVHHVDPDLHEYLIKKIKQHKAQQYDEINERKRQQELGEMKWLEEAKLLRKGMDYLLKHPEVLPSLREDLQTHGYSHKRCLRLCMTLSRER